VSSNQTWVTSLDGNVVMSREVGILFCFHNSAYCLMGKNRFLLDWAKI
jgi:hypothetical protein